MGFAKISFSGDQKYIQRIRDNDRSVLGDLFTRHRKMVYKYITRQGGTDADAEDLLLEAIILLWQKVHHGKFQLSTRLNTFLMAVVKYKWKVERSQRRLHRTTRKSAHRTVEELLSPEWLPSLQEVELVREALEAIPPVCRQMLLLYYFEGRSLRNITRALHFSSPQAVEERINQCMDRLEEQLKNLLLANGGE